MEKVINKVSLKQQTSDFQYWQQQTGASQICAKYFYLGKESY